MGYVVQEIWGTRPCIIRGRPREAFMVSSPSCGGHDVRKLSQCAPCAFEFVRFTNGHELEKHRMHIPSHTLCERN